MSTYAPDVLWHWTTPAKLACIVKDGRIKPHRDGDLARVLPVVWLTTDPELNFWNHEDALEVHSKTVRIGVTARADLASTALDLPEDLLPRLALDLGMPDPSNDWFVSFGPIPVDAMQCVAYGNARFKTVTLDDETLRFAPFE